MSLVDVSPSTETMLNVLAMSVESAFCSMAGEMAQSVVMNTSIVAILGWIMPEPLQMPPILHSLPPTVKLTAISLRLVSVVMMPSAASAECGPRFLTSSGIPAAMGAISSSCPMTPVEATTTSELWICRAWASSSLICSAISMPLALQVLALPLLQMTACALPSARCCFVTTSGAPLTRFVV